jgi:aminopeptidase
MDDPRAVKLADLLLDYSVEARPDDRLMIQFDPVYTRYATLIGEKARARGVNVRYDTMTHDPVVQRGFIERFDTAELQEELERRIEMSQWCNARILVHCLSNPDYAKGIPDSEAKVAEFNKRVIGPYNRVLYRSGLIRGYEVKWNIVGFPTEASAALAGMSLGEYNDFVYSATVDNDWQIMSEKMQRIKSTFDFAHDVHIYVHGQTDLHLSLKDRGGEICDGRLNMPDGEVCYGPVEDSVNGHIYFQVPSKLDGFEILQGIRLEFENGVIQRHSARQNQKALDEILKIDEGVKRVGELGIGCNYHIKRAIFKTIFDEKIGGTIHLALGDSFTEQPLTDGGGLNKSDLHWDIVCDLRRNPSNTADYPGGELYVDGTLVQKDGVWKF